MPRTLIVVAGMCAKDGFKEHASFVPDDYHAKYEDFWNYVITADILQPEEAWTWLKR